MAREHRANKSDLFIHESSYVDSKVKIGIGTKIWHFCHVMPNATIGSGCVLGQNVFIGPRVRIGNNVRIQNNVSIYEGVELEDEVFCGPSMVFTNVINPRSAVSRKHEFLPTLVKRGATLGANSTILCGHTIGRYSFTAAGAVITHDVTDFALMMGMPARRAGWVCECGVRLVGETIVKCAECGAGYTERNGTLLKNSMGHARR